MPRILNVIVVTLVGVKKDLLVAVVVLYDTMVRVDCNNHWYPCCQFVAGRS